MLKTKAAQKSRPKNDVKHSAWIQSFFDFLPSQIKFDDILPDAKMNDVNNTETGKTNKSVKCKHRFCLNCLASCFLSGKNEEESHCPACKMNALKTDISPSSDLPTVLSLLKIQCNTCSKM